MTRKGGALVTSTRGLKRDLLRSLLITYIDPADDLGRKEEFRFDLDRKWRFDVAFTRVKVALEFQGGAYAQGRHVRGAGYEADAWKLAAAQANGWAVFYVTWQMLREDLNKVGDYILLAVKARRRAQEEETMTVPVGDFWRLARAYHAQLKHAPPFGVCRAWPCHLYQERHDGPDQPGEAQG